MGGSESEEEEGDDDGVAPHSEAKLRSLAPRPTIYTTHSTHICGLHRPLSLSPIEVVKYILHFIVYQVFIM